MNVKDAYFAGPYETQVPGNVSAEFAGNVVDLPPEMMAELRPVAVTSANLPAPEMAGPGAIPTDLNLTPQTEGDFKSIFVAGAGSPNKPFGTTGKPRTKRNRRRKGCFGKLTVLFKVIFSLTIYS